MMQTEQTQITNATTDEAWARERIATWFEAAGIEPSWPATTETVAKLLATAEYSIGTPDGILTYVNGGYVPTPIRVAGRFAWSACDVVNLARAAEYRRAWLPFSKLHDCKKTMIELTVQQANRDGVKSIFGDIDEVSADDILHHLTGCQNPVLREALAQALRDKLRIEADA